MKKFLLFVVIVVVIIYWATNFIKTGKLQKFIDDNSDKEWAPKVQFYLGDIYQTFSKPDKAEFCFNRVLENYTSSQFLVDSMYRLGVIYEDTKRFSQAKEIYKKILDEHPDYERIKMVETRYGFVMNY
ncbi:MAG: tetratricopeptide repeat protein [Elusimicrobiota bacterium]